jgi:RNA polymerase sigma-70 factor (ECF subfamily)
LGVDAVVDLEDAGAGSQRREWTPQPVRRSRAIEIEPVYVDHYRDVYRYLLLLTRSVPEAEDLTAETFERAIRAWDRDEGLRERPLPWLLLTGRRLATDRWRRARRLLGLLPLLRRSIGESSTEHSTEFWLWFDAVARVLTKRQREVLVLRYQRDLGDDDIAEVMGLSPSGVDPS